MSTIYGSNVADLTLSTACQMSTTSGGTETSNTTTIASTSNPYAEFLSKGGASTAVASLPAPTGNGWIWWPGAGTFALGNWSAIHTHSAVSHGVNSVIRFYKYSAGVYTSIGSITGPTQTLTVKTSYTHAATSMASVTLASGDGIYVDLWWFDNNANSGGDNPTNFISNSGTAGVASDMQVTTSTFTPAATTVSRTIPTSAVLQSLALPHTVPTSAVLKSLGLSRTIPTSAVLKSLGLSRIVPTSGVVGITNSRTIPTSAVLTNSGSRTIPTSAVLKSLGLSRTIPTSAVLKSTNNSRIIPTSAVVSANSSRTIPTSAVLTAEIASGGFTLFANTASGTVIFGAFRATQYPDPALSLNKVLPRLGTSSASWNANTPDNTTLTIKTSTDGINWSAATSGSSIPGLTGQPAATIDTFTANTSANYTSTNKSGGSTATATIDTTNSRLTLVGGSGALLLNSALSDDDIEIIVDMDRSDAGGIVWRYVDASNYYELGCYDDSSSSGFTNQLRLYKVASGTRSLLGSASAVTWARATAGLSPYKTIRVTMLSGVISVFSDGTLMQTYTDGSPLAAGKMGLRNDGGTSRYYQLRIQTQGDYVSGTVAGDIASGKFVYTQTSMNTTDPSVTPQLYDLTTSARSPQIETGGLITQLHDPSETIAAKFNDEIDSLAQTSGSLTNGGDFYWNVDDNGSAIFSSRHATKAPFCLYSTDLLYKPDVAPAFGADLYRNKQTIKNCINTIDITDEEKIADGSASSWNMAYELYSAPTITVQEVAKTVGVAGTDTGKDFYWTAGSSSISQDTSATRITAGYIIKVTYTGQYKDIVTRDNLPEQAAQKVRENNLTSGIVEAIEDGKKMLTSNAISYADGLLARYSNPNPVQIKFTTLRSGLAEGMILPCFIPEFQINNRQLLILNISVSAWQQADGSILYEYAVTASDGPNLNNWLQALTSK